MSRRRKHRLFTADGHPIEVYKKGRKHRIFVDMVTGELVATNPLPLLALAASTLAPSLIQAGVDRLSAPAPAPEFSAPRQRISSFEKALAVEQLERKCC